MLNFFQWLELHLPSSGYCVTVGIKGFPPYEHDDEDALDTDSDEVLASIPNISYRNYCYETLEESWKIFRSYLQKVNTENSSTPSRIVHVSLTSYEGNRRVDVAWWNLGKEKVHLNKHFDQVEKLLPKRR